jgi:trans-aconitate 2-methyltransferase
MNDWNPELYLRYENERTLPSRDLISRIAVTNPSDIIDMGCGPGNSTRVLRERWPGARILGLDNSPDMIRKAKEAYPRGQWILADAAVWKPDRKCDIVFSNATLQWIPGQEIVIRTFFDALNSSGALAVQVPADDGSPLRRAVLRVAGTGDWKDRMEGCDRRIAYHDETYYYDQLSPLARRIEIWNTTYFHRMAGHPDLVDWYASTGMKPFLDRLSGGDSKREFQSRVLEECRDGYPPQGDGCVLFPFKRIFFIAYKD